MMMVNIAGVLLIALIIWWFWLYKPKEVNAGVEGVTIVVDNGVYQPARIKIPAERGAIIQFLRKDASSCAATLLFPNFNISQELPLGKSVNISLPAMKKGEYAFHCQMQMYRGLLIVE